MKNKLLRQARHNKETCLKLHELEKYNDWVATTAFYSALHFVKYKLFPLEILLEGHLRLFYSFDAYLDYLRNEKGIYTNAHRILNDLVTEYLPFIDGEYGYLFDKSWRARYNFFKVKEYICQKILADLEKIEKHCCN